MKNRKVDLYLQSGIRPLGTSSNDRELHQRSLFVKKKTNTRVEVKEIK